MAEGKSFVSIVCTSCRQEFEAPLDVVGQTVECPSCGAHLVVRQTPDPGSGSATQAQLDAMKSRTIRIELGDL